jgi:cytochrome o ubiquinol oxidase subunit 2
MIMLTKPRRGHGRAIRLFFLVILGLALVLKLLMYGHNIALLNPKGLIASEQMGLMLFATGWLLAIAVPVVGLLYFTAWKYRDSNASATYAPETTHGRWASFGIWAIPSLFMVVLSVVMWTSTHRMQPQKAIASDVKPVTIQVVALRWKWLFIYPEQKIATVNFVQIPTNTPVKFELTADDAPMSSFWIPNLGGMLYAMTGHVNALNLMATKPGDYEGKTAEITGAGFAGMKFTTRASSKADFDKWVQEVKWYPEVLGSTEYDQLLQPSEDHPAAFYSDYESGLYDKVLMKYMSGHSHE